MNLRQFGSACLMLAAGSAVNAQVVINELVQDPPGPDEAWEYIEFYGRPNMDLSGYAVGLFKGGADTNGDDIAETPPEIDEAFTLDGLSLGPNGFLILINDTAGPTDVELFVDPATPIAFFTSAHVPNPNDTPGKLGNGDSSTYLLVRARPNHSIAGSTSTYDPGYVFWKDENPDVNFDGKLDFGIEGGSALEVDPLQIVDEVAWSNNGGKEYVRSSQQEISETPGFDPDALSRYNYTGSNMGLGNRVKSDMTVDVTRMADEEWIYGEIVVLPAALDEDAEYGSDVKGPTDPNGQSYDCPASPTGEGDCFADVNGQYLFDDIELYDSVNSVGFGLTPGTFNDNALFGAAQFRWVLADFDFDGDADADDLALIQSSQGATLDDRIDCIDPDTGSPIIDPSTGNPFQCYAFEGRDFNAIEAMRWMDPADGAGGGNADEVTAADVAAAEAIIPTGRLCADSNEDGLVTPTDFTAWINLFNNNDLRGDVNQDGSVTPTDFTAWIAAFNLGPNGPICNP